MTFSHRVHRPTWQEIQREKLKVKEQRERICTCPCYACKQGMHRNCLLKDYETVSICRA